MLHICNVTGSAQTLRLCLVPNGGTPTSANAILWDFSIAANDVQELLKGDIWQDGSGTATLQAQASANTSVNIKLAGIETT
jgi:2-keto-4-pentenoate hydratase